VVTTSHASDERDEVCRFARKFAVLQGSLQRCSRSFCRYLAVRCQLARLLLAVGVDAVVKQACRRLLGAQPRPSSRGDGTFVSGLTCCAPGTRMVRKTCGTSSPRCSTSLKLEEQSRTYTRRDQAIRGTMSGDRCTKEDVSGRTNSERSR